VARENKKSADPFPPFPPGKGGISFYMANWKIEPANLRDLKALRSVERECFGDDAWPLLDLIYVLSAPNLVRLKVVVNNHMIGFAAGEKDISKNLGWITTIGILADYRRQGIAAALLNACEQNLKCGVIRLCVRRSNQPAIYLYQKVGYFQIDIWKSYYHDKEDAFVFEKRTNADQVGKSY
jgi:N-alpha-acetyltransferase 10/11